jgi:pimeloyl-ACP methyl ester carboxylesterase
VLRDVFAGPRTTTRDEVIQQRSGLFARLARRDIRPARRMSLSGRGVTMTAATVHSASLVKPSRQLPPAIAPNACDTSRSPFLVIHGLVDRMCDVSGGQATAESIPGAELVLIEGMGHNLPPGLRSQLAERIAEFVWRSEGRRAITKS